MILHSMSPVILWPTAMNVMSESNESTRLAAPCSGRGVYAVSVRVRWDGNVEWKLAPVATSGQVII